ncbi:hypothetical protein FIU82_07635 [Pseudoalteromonas sp. THAF3]|uniref:hypothetical protein n=1 Tax=unclassified Pseudoalteromonas TaxID=194690 RepID=UPI0006B54A83|nr:MULTISPECIES: hypothetical protein [unclassified Pseudoalteromonas]QFU04884.1 hypothetical protein FIU82_07635 [Pseudoalteromonas sp. THAF3]GAP76755.1 hypothetical protein W04_3327 [Pseudoalteromonas sp. SW0106-04]|tara:strand:+ start:1396 stop:1872 length:477 start_codon:yes stop_codon:yes gene_type:complete
MIDFKRLLRNAGFITDQGLIDRKGAMAALGVSESTLDRWMRTNKPTPSATTLLESMAAGGIPQQGDWVGFMIGRDGRLHTPHGASYSPQELERVWLLMQSNRFKDRTIINLRREISQLHNLVHTRDKLREMGTELVNMADNWEFLNELAEVVTDDTGT